MKNFNPVDPVIYELLDTFNRTGNIRDNPTPIIGADWEAKSDVLNITNPAGYMEFPVGTNYAAGATAPSMHSITPGNTIAFDLTFATAGKALFIGIRNDGNYYGEIAVSKLIEIRIRDTSPDVYVRVREIETDDKGNDVINNTLIDTVAGGELGTTKTPVVISDNRENISVKIGSMEPVIIATNRFYGGSYFYFGGNADSNIRISNLRVW